MKPAAESDVAAWPNEPRAFVLAGAVTVAMLLAAGATFAVLGEVGAAALAGGSFVAGWMTLVWNVHRPRFRVGADGLSVRDRFIAWSDVERIDRDEGVYGKTHHLAWLVLRSGERIRLGARLGIIGHAALAKIDAAYDDLEQRLAAHRARKAAEFSAELARGQRSEAEWLAEVRKKSEDGGFRDGRIARADLLAALEDPTADPTARAAAALALKKGLAPEERARVRVAAAASAAPRVRVALEAAADEHASEEKVAGLVRRAAR